ncbi:MAG: amidohydrolase/deacetylase family metallohydrolase [Chloroflexota bacterium]
MYDLLITGGRVIDPAQGIDAALDIAVSGGRIEKVAEGISSDQCRQVVDAKDKIVTPGLIDIHTHVYDGVNKISTDPDTAGVTAGVTTVVDAGSSGQATFGAFPKYVIPSFRTRVFCFLNLSSTGLSLIPEIRDWGDIDVDAATAVIASNSDLIKGIKVRMVGKGIAKIGVEGVKAAQNVAKQFALPIMVHIGDIEKAVPESLVKEVVTLMEPGDILSHVFTPQHGSLFRGDGTMLSELREAMERGVVLDVANGRFNFSFSVARGGLAQGVLPTTISSDLTMSNMKDSVFSLTVTMSKFLALGLGLGQLIEMTTVNPARALKAEVSLGSLKPGGIADISILELVSGKWRLPDSKGESLVVDTLITPRMTVKSGNLIMAQPAAQPKLWEG